MIRDTLQQKTLLLILSMSFLFVGVLVYPSYIYAQDGSGDGGSGSSAAAASDSATNSPSPSDDGQQGQDVGVQADGVGSGPILFTSAGRTRFPPAEGCDFGYDETYVDVLDGGGNEGGGSMNRYFNGCVFYACPYNFSPYDKGNGATICCENPSVYNADVGGCYIPPTVITCNPGTDSRSLLCPAGQTGGITETKTLSCPAGSWSPWVETTNTCGTTPTTPTTTAPPTTSTETCSLTAAPISIAPGNSSTLAWSCSQSSSASWNLFSNSAGTGSRSVSPSNTTTYSMQCNTGGCSKTVQVTVIQPALSISANPSRVHSGNASTITWNATGVTSCALKKGTATVASCASGASCLPTHTVSSGAINTQTIFTLSCATVVGDKSATATVLITPSVCEVGTPGCSE